MDECMRICVCMGGRVRVCGSKVNEKKSVQGSAAATKQQTSSKSRAMKKIRRLSRVPEFFLFVFVLLRSFGFVLKERRGEKRGKRVG